MNNPQQVKKYGKKRSGAPDDVRRAPMRDRTNTFDSLELMATSPTRKRSVDEHDIVASASFTTRRQFAPDFATNIPSMTSQRNKIKKPNAIEDHLTGAPLDHITLLVKQIKAAESRKSQFQDPDYFSMLLNDIPQDYPQLLRSFGFDESVAGDHIKYSIPLSQFKVLRAALEKLDPWTGKCGPASEDFLELPRSNIRINTDPEYLSSIPPDKTVAASPLSLSGFEGLSLNTPHADTRVSNFSFVTSAASVDVSMHRLEPNDKIDKHPSSGRFTPSFSTLFEESGPGCASIDSTDSEVHRLMISSCELNGLVPGSNGDVASSRSSSLTRSASRPQSYAMASPPNDSPIALGAEFSFGNPNSAFKGCASNSRSFAGKMRSSSAPEAPGRHFSPVREETLSKTLHCTPTHCKFADSAAPSTHFLNKFQSPSSCAKSSGKVKDYQWMPVMSAPPEEPYTTSHPPLLDRRIVSCPSAINALTSNRRALSERERGRNSEIVRVNSVSIMDSSPIITRKEMYCIPEYGEDSADESGRTGRSAQENRMSTLKKKRLSDSKRLRMSKKMSKQKSRRSSIFSLKKSSRSNAIPVAQARTGGQLPSSPTVSNIFPVVVGGEYQQTFEFNRPVVYESSQSFSRVHAIEMPNLISSPIALRTSILRLRKWYMSTVRNFSYSAYESNGDIINVVTMVPGVEDSQHIVSLGSNWTVIPAYPGGLLIVSTAFYCENDIRRLAFFVPDHFLRRELMCDIEQSDDADDLGYGAHSSSCAMGLDMDLDSSQCTEATEIDDMECIPMYSMLDSSMMSDESRDAGLDMHCSTNHLFDALGDSGAMDSPAVLGAGDFSPTGAAPGHNTRPQCYYSNMDDDVGLTKKGNAYFKALFQKDGPLYACQKHDLKNSGDVLELVLSFLQGGKDVPLIKITRTVSDGRLKKSRSVRSNAPGENVSLPIGYAAVPSVSRRWAVNWTRYTCSHWSKAKWNTRSTVEMDAQYSIWASYVAKYMSGTAFGSGGAKTVYRLQPSGNGGGLIQRSSTVAEALAVIDVDNVMEHAVEQELIVSVACSAVAKAGICPNIVTIHSTFQSPFPAPEKWYGISSTSIIPNRFEMSTGHYQYINMEFCSGEDVETHIRNLKKKSLSHVEIRNILFQMCFSIYSCREQLSLRHFDVKLLNFLLADTSVLLGKEKMTSPRYDKVNYCVSFGSSVYTLQLSLNSPGVVKLADFGTSLIGQDVTRSSITEQQFTTLENTAPEFLFLGSAVSSSSFNADTFSLGLSFLHLVTGHAPYEELLEHVRCPPALQQALERIWVTSDTTSPYFVISEVLRSLEVMSDTNNSADADETVMAVLYDTLYRYIVLLGLPNADLFTIGDVSAFRNPVVCAVLDVLDQGMNENADADVQIATMKYIGDSKIWNISTGNHSILKVARNKLAQVSPEAELWLRRMLCYDPLHRCLMLELMTSTLFDPLRGGAKDHTIATRNQTPNGGAAFTASYTYYYRSSGESQLPML